MEEFFERDLIEELIDDNILFDLEDEKELQAFGSSGGKSRVSSKIVEMIPDHSTYLEPFAGGAAVFWKKDLVKENILNDKNSEIAFAYNFIKNASVDQVNKLRQMNWKPTKKLFFQLRDSTPPQDSVQRFYRFYYVHAYSYGLSSKTYGYKTNRVSIFNRIPKLQEKLKHVKIFNESYSKILKEYNSQETFAYLDPPYPDEWAGPEGTKLFSKENTQELHDILKEFKGKFLLSINDLPWIKEMFSDFKINNLEVPRSFRKGDEPKIELIISNYDVHSTKKENQKNLDVTASPATAGSPVSSGGLQPIGYPKKKKEKIGDNLLEQKELSKNIELELEEIKELFVVKKGDKWCVIHGHPKKPDSKTDKPAGSIIKCFPGTPEGKRKADAMHAAIIISKIRRGEMSEEDNKKFFDEITNLVEKFKPITLIHNFVSMVGSHEGGINHEPNDVDIQLRMNDVQDYLERAVRVRIDKMAEEKLSKRIHIFSSDADSNDNFIPVYHLALIPASQKYMEMEEELIEKEKTEEIN